MEDFITQIFCFVDNLYQNLLLTSYCAPFLILLLCVNVPRNNGLLLVTSPLTAGHKSMFITVLRNRFWYDTVGRGMQTKLRERVLLSYRTCACVELTHWVTRCNLQSFKPTLITLVSRLYPRVKVNP